VPITAVTAALADTDVLVSCTGATGVVLPLAVVAAARTESSGPLAVVDLALPHDVDPAVAELPGVSLFDLARLADEVHHGHVAADVTAVRLIVTEEISAFLAARTSATVTPTVVALRTMATGIVESEMRRLTARLPDLDPDVRAEVEHAVRRVADKLLHQPTVRVKQLANQTGAVSYAAALAELFALDPDAVEAVTSPARGGGE
jgi:glutamyl-tRNA reductase